MSALFNTVGAPLGTVQSVFFRDVNYENRPVVSPIETKKPSFVFFLRTSTGKEIAVILCDGEVHSNPHMRIIEHKDENKPEVVLGISEFGHFSFEAFDSLITDFDEDSFSRFSRLSNEYWLQLIGYTVECTVEPIEFEGGKFPHSLRIKLTKDTDSGIDTRVLSIVPSFHPCIACESEPQIDVVYKVGDVTINELLIETNYTPQSALSVLIGKPADWSEAKEQERKEAARKKKEEEEAERVRQQEAARKREEEEEAARKKKEKQSRFVVGDDGWSKVTVRQRSK
jgi:hypothetical protein